KYSDFFFGNESMELESIESHFIKQSLDEDGQTEVSWERPEIDSVPSALGAVIECKVIQEGGRQVPASEFVPINVYDRYVGIKKIRGYAAEMGSKVKFDVILVSGDGEYVPDQQLTYRIYKQRRYWWWHYGSRARFMKHYKSDEDTVLVREGEITSREGVASIEHLLDDYGEMLIEVEDPASGHTAAYFFRSRWWGSSDSDASPDIVTIKTDKELYYPGDEAEVHLNTPEKGSVLLTVEKSGEIIYQKWQDIEGHDTEIVVPITEEFLPNAYIYAAVFQPYEQTVNDLPIRMYGVLPITVEKPDARLNFEIEAPESIEPNTDFEVKINANKQAQFTIAVVDEGLLDITDFQTPDPLKYFFARERLDIRTYDNYSQIVGLDSGYIYNTFSVGGGIQKEDYREKQQQSDETERFKPVALFSGPVKTDENGEAVVSFSMPNYIGRVRVMVVGAAEGSYGNAEADIAVKSPLMILPTLPRVLGPEDRIKVPVTVFGLEDDLGEVKVSIETEGPVEVTGYNEKTLKFREISTKNIEFELSALRAIGASRIIIRAESSGVVSQQRDSSVNGENTYTAEKIVDLAVRSYNPYTYLQEDKAVMADSTEVFTVPEEGLRNSSNAQLTVSSRKSLNINTRLKWLIRYPYGCIEQTTSSAFPQLYLDELLGLSTERRHEIDDNINATIDRLRKFQLDNGGFSYWPYGDSVNYWGTNYAGHFLLEAKRKGYYVPEDMYNGWIKYQKERSQQNSSRMLTRAYRLYLLALAGEENLNAMNYMRESKLDEMNNIAEFYLAAAYKYAGYDDVGTELMEGLDLKVDDYNEFSGSYGSSIRDKAIILEVLTLFEDYQRGLALYNNLADDLSSDSWLSTQTTAYSLMAGSKYLASFDTTVNQARGYILLPDNEQIDFKLEENIQTIPLNCYGDDIKVVNTSELPVFASLEWEGIPLHDTVETEDNNLFLTVNWYDEDGNKIDPSTLPQGTTFWGRFTIDKEYRKDVDEIALVQILPSGWEIENVRLLESSLPHWMDDYRLNHEEYLDIRDDRIMWFFDLDRYSYKYDFVVKLNAVTVGDFYLPPTVVEAMYNNRFKATKAGRGISVTGR
ncbi:MAG: alpha-2-macroglobulin family protein, partial [Halanaerobiales bacterium]